MSVTMVPLALLLAAIAVLVTGMATLVRQQRRALARDDHRERVRRTVGSA